MRRQVPRGCSVDPPWDCGGHWGQHLRGRVPFALGSWGQHGGQEENCCPLMGVLLGISPTCSSLLPLGQAMIVFPKTVLTRVLGCLVKLWSHRPLGRESIRKACYVWGCVGTRGLTWLPMCLSRGWVLPVPVPGIANCVKKQFILAHLLCGALAMISRECCFQNSGLGVLQAASPMGSHAPV